MAKKPYTIISMGGSIIAPKEGFDVSFLRRLRRFFLDEVQTGRRFVIVVGGGATARAYQAAAHGAGLTHKATLDWIGIDAIRLNVSFVQHLLDGVAAAEILIDPDRLVKTKRPILLAGGWKPGRSTDFQAVRLAKTYGATHVINASNIPFVYDRDPRLDAQAQSIREIDWATFRRTIVGSSWQPGKSAPFDPIASREAEKLQLTVAVLDGRNLKEVKKAIEGKSFRGTVIHP